MTREKIIEIFEKHRKTPGAPVNEDRFLEFLLDPPRNIRNSFGGLRRYNAFLRDVQMEYGVCFSHEDHEKKWPLEKFIKRVEEKMKNPAASKALATKLLKRERSSIMGGVMAAIMLFALGSYLVMPLFAVLAGLTGISLLMAVPVVLWLILSALIFSLIFKSIQYHKRLKDKIDTL